jgi:hypothetical protein
VRDVIGSIEREYRRYKGYAEATFGQLSDAQLSHVPAAEGNSIAILVWHVAGNLKSRFTDFLTSDGEKPWRQRESEFDDRRVTHDQLRQKWDEGWDVLFAALGKLTDDELGKMVTIRGEALAVHEALHRSLAHTSSHVGQIILLGKTMRGAEWRSLTIPRTPGGARGSPTY